MNMNSAMATIRRKHKYEALQKEVERIRESFAAKPELKHRATIKVTRILILNGPYVMQGRYRDINAKSMGAGVYELYTTEVGK
uniref:Uncharacterized protein n=1 Tax=viral metagenome TaxID=1070528 RepID=A0A6H2A363_9ZZZZ